MAKRPAFPPKPPPDPFRAPLDHVRMWWAAEEENARRMSRRVNLQLTVIAAFFGLGVIRLLERPIPSQVWAWAFNGIFFFGLGFLGLAALHLLSVLPLSGLPTEQEMRDERAKKIRRYRRWRGGAVDDWLWRSLARNVEKKERSLPASAGLRYDFETVSDLSAILQEHDRGSGVFEQGEAFFKTLDAANELADLNIREGYRIDKAQQHLWKGFGGIFLAVVVYGFGSSTLNGDALSGSPDGVPRAEYLLEERYEQREPTQRQSAPPDSAAAGAAAGSGERSEGT